MQLLNQSKGNTVLEEPPIATRRPSRRASRKYQKGQHLEWRFKKQKVLCTFGKAAPTPRNLTEVNMPNGDIRHVQMTELVERKYGIGETIQCRDLRSPDPEKREYWYDASVVKVIQSKGQVKYVVKPVQKDQELVTVEGFHARDIEWKKHQPQAVSAGPQGPTYFQQQCDAESAEEEKAAKQQEEKSEENRGRDITDMLPSTPVATPATPDTPSGVGTPSSVRVVDTRLIFNMTPQKRPRSEDPSPSPAPAPATATAPVPAPAPAPAPAPVPAPAPAAAAPARTALEEDFDPVQKQLLKAFNDEKNLNGSRLLAAVKAALKKYPIRHAQPKKRRRIRTPGHRLSIKVIQRRGRRNTGADRLQVYVPQAAQFDPQTGVSRKYLYCTQEGECNVHNAKFMEFFRTNIWNATDELNDEDLIEWVHRDNEKGSQHPAFVYICHMWQQQSQSTVAVSAPTSVEASVEPSTPSTPVVIQETNSGTTTM